MTLRTPAITTHVVVSVGAALPKPGKSSVPFPRGELEAILIGALWKRRHATARELFDAVGRPRGVVYTTVAKVLDRMVEKGLVKRRRVGRAWEYTPAVRRADTHRAMARELIERLTGGGARPAVAALLGALEDVDPELLNKLEAELRSWREGSDGA